MFAAPDVYQHRSAWHHGECAGAEYALGFPGQRQQAHGDVGLLEEFFQLVGAVINRDLFFVSFVSHPCGDLKTERLQGQGRGFCHFAETQEADSPLFRANDRGAAPFFPGLRRRVAGHVAMETKHVHDDVFRHHWVSAWGLDFAERGFGEFGMRDEGLDPGGAAEHGFQVREVGEGTEIGVHEGEVFYLRRVAGIGPEADFLVGEMFMERVAPCLGVADVFVEIDDEEGHGGLLGAWGGSV